MSNLNIYTEKLRESGLRPTRQRLKICEVLFSTKKTFHFTINDLNKIIEEKLSEKISLATVYNTVHAFKKKGYLKEIAIATDKSYFDTNTGTHSHFFDIKNSELIDIDISQVDLKNIPNPPAGKKIKNIDIIINVESE
jgi:Fur family iron response transcriptional regulator|tara:strand:+ start:110 stop:523 length:414 start_codon:yes stop_codon:yes gene_type:complete